MLYSSTRAHAHASRFVGFGLKKSGNVSLVVHRPTKTVISSVVYGFANSTPSYQVIATTHFPLPSQIACSYWPASRSHPWPVADESRWQSIVPVNPNATLFELVNATAWRVTSKFAGGSPWADDPLPPPTAATAAKADTDADANSITTSPVSISITFASADILNFAYADIPIFATYASTLWFLLKFKRLLTFFFQ